MRVSFIGGVRWRKAAVGSKDPYCDRVDGNPDVQGGRVDTNDNTYRPGFGELRKFELGLERKFNIGHDRRH